MVLTTTIARVDDPLVLCESMDQAESEQMNLYKVVKLQGETFM